MNNTKKGLVLVLFLTFVFLNGCSRECPLEGEVFIVTRGGQNVKLGLVEVKALPEKETIVFVEKKKAEAKEKIGAVTTERNRLQAEAVIAKRESDDYQKQHTDWWRGAKYQVATRLAKAADAAAAKYKNAESTYKHWSNGMYLFDNLPEGGISAKTNADGKFIMTLNQNTKYALVAHARREILKEVEEYYWMVWFIPKDKTNRIFLSNDNLFDVDSPNNVVRHADLPQ